MKPRMGGQVGFVDPTGFARGWAIPSILIAIILVASGSATGSSWLHEGYDTEFTGDIPFNGPRTNDTALSFQLPGTAESVLLDGEDAYVRTYSNPELREDLSETALWRLNVTTAQTERLVDFPDSNAWPLLVAPELDRVLVVDGDELTAIDIGSGEEDWRTTLWPELDEFEKDFENPLISDGVAFVGIEVWDEESLGDDSHVKTIAMGVVAVDMDTGETLAEWRRPMRLGDQTALTDVSGELSGPASMFARIERITVDADHIYVYSSVWSALYEANTETWVWAQSQYELWALERGTLEHLWHATDEAQNTAGAGGNDLGEGVDGVDRLQSAFAGGRAVAGDSMVYIRLDEVTALNPATGEPIWTSGAGEADQIQIQGSLSMGLGKGVLVGTSPQTVYGLDPVTGEIKWLRMIEDREIRHSTGTAVIDEDTAYVMASREGDHPLAYGYDARDLETGELKWRWEYVPDVGSPGSRSAYPAFGEGFFVWGGWDGMVHVVGTTEASLEPVADVESAYPEPGEEVRVDLSATNAGVHGEADRYRAEWGDGSTTGWQQDPLLTHTYQEEEEVTARFIVGNDAGQTASVTKTFYVGEEQPSEPNWISERFEPENQDMTFGVLGILVALTGGVIGVGHRYRKRSRLQEEIEALEEGFDRTQSNPGECEAFLDTRKARAQSMLLDGDLGEEQFGVMERRIEEMHRDLRTSVLDDRFQFLPYGMVQSLKKMLADGRISTWEREAIDDLLEREKALSQTQKDQVRTQLDRWFTEDAGGGES